MLESKPLNKIIFLDLETVPQKKSFYELSERMQELFQWRFKKEYAELGLGRMEHYIQEAAEKILNGKRKVPSETERESVKTLAQNTMTAEDRSKMESLYQNKASLFSEFGKIICCSIGWFDIPELDKVGFKIPEDMELKFKTVSFADHDERQLLQHLHTKMGVILNMPFNHSHHLCAYNGKVFDFPFLAKRFILNGLPLPRMLDTDGKKPWDLTYFVDPKETWTFNVRDNAVTLDLLCETFNVPSSKDDIKGSEVRKVYYEDNDLPRIVKYCEKDVVALATVYIRMKSMLNKVSLVEK